jgi:hypothetical protein
MKSAASQSRQTMLIYVGTIVALFALIYPYTYWLEGVKKQKDLGEATIGQVDTGSFMLKLALLGGARGIAANVLWTHARDLQKAQEWDRLKATVDMITRLQPHFLAIWTFQSWNLAYNVSVEWDAPEDKYLWIKRGIQFAEDGVEKNVHSPDLVFDVASYYYHKLGFSDESIILRRLFRDDDDEKFKTDPIEKVVRNDNFQVARGWFTKAVRLVDSGQVRTAGVEAPVDFVDPPVQRKGRPGDIPFRSMPAHAQTRYAAGLEKESIVGVPATFGEVARTEWARTRDAWLEFGLYTWDSFNVIEVQGKLVHQPVQIDDVTRYEEIEKFATDQKYWQNVLKIPVVTLKECAELTKNKLHWTSRWADQMNYPYWKDRSQAEMEPDGVQARRLFYEGTKAYRSAELPDARDKFRDGLVIWDRVLKRHPLYRNDDLNRKDTGVILRRYTRVLAALNEQIPEDLPFKDLLAAALKADNAPDPFDAQEILPAASQRRGEVNLNKSQ